MLCGISAIVVSIVLSGVHYYLFLLIGWTPCRARGRTNRWHRTGCSSVSGYCGLPKFMSGEGGGKQVHGHPPFPEPGVGRRYWGPASSSGWRCAWSSKAFGARAVEVRLPCGRQRSAEPRPDICQGVPAPALAAGRVAGRGLRKRRRHGRFRVCRGRGGSAGSAPAAALAVAGHRRAFAFCDGPWGRAVSSFHRSGSQVEPGNANAAGRRQERPAGAPGNDGRGQPAGHQ